MADQIDPVIFQLIADSAPFNAGFQKAAAEAEKNGGAIASTISNLNKMLLENQQYLDASDQAARKYAEDWKAASAARAAAETAASSAIVGGMEAAKQSAAGAAGALTSFGNVSGGVAREVGVLFGEGLRGNFTRMEGSLVTLANRMNIMGTILSPLGVGIAALAGGIAYLAYNLEQNVKENEQFNAALLSTNAAAGTTVQGLRDLTNEIIATGTSSKDAQEDVLSLAQSGKVAGIEMQQAAEGAAAFADLTGDKIGQATKEFEKLATNPVQALTTLNASMHLVDASVIQQVADAERLGNSYLAGALAIQAVASAVEEADQKKKAFESDNGFWAQYTSAANAAAAAEGGVVDELDQEKRARDAVRDAAAKQAAQEAVIYNAVNTSVTGYVVSLEKEAEQLERNTQKVGETKEALVQYDIQKAESAAKSIALAAAENLFFTEIKNGTNVFKAAWDAEVLLNNALAGAQVALSAAGDKALEAARAYDQHAAAVKAAKAAEEEQKKTATELANAEIAVIDQLSKQVEMDPKIRAAQDAYNTAVDKANTLLATNDQALSDGNENMDEWLVNWDNANTLLETAEDRLAKTTANINAYNEALGEAGTKLDQLNAKWTSENSQIGQNSQAIAYNNERLKDEKQALDAWLADKQKYGDAVTKTKDEVIAEADAHAALTMQIKQQAEAIKVWEGIAQQGFYSFGDDIAKELTGAEGSFKNFEKNVLGDFRNFIAAIISEILKLTVFNGVINSLFGTSLPTASFGGLAGGFSSLLSGGGASALGVASAGGGNLLGGGTGTGLVGQAISGAGGIGSLWSGVPGATGSSFLGGPSYYMDANGWMQGTTYAPSTLGNVIGIGGGILAGIGEYKAAGGGAAGLLGGATYGLGTLAATGAIGGILSGAGASAGIAGSLGAIGLGAVPIIGEIALGAMALNMLTGGGLFGTAYKPTGNTGFNISTDGSGVDLSASYEEKKKKALFGGSKTKTVSAPVDQSTQDSFDQWYNALDTGLNQLATKFGEKSADVISSTFDQTFDKSGKVTSTKETVGGVTYHDTTAQQYEERVDAESMITVMDKVGAGVGDFVKGLQGDADKLYAAVQDAAGTMVAAQTNLAGGFKMMALSSNQTIGDVMKFVEKMNQGGESLSQTYTRLVQAQQQYDSFTKQFAPAKTYVDAYEAQLASINDQMNANIAQADAYAKAAGAEGASVEDLTNIHKYAAQEIAQALAKLQEAAQQQAFALGLSNIGSIDQINSELDKLTQEGTVATKSVSNFGAAISQVSQAAKDAMSLMLGSLSPYNDQQKLQIALNGLRAGTASREDVLNIGRELYASSQAYTNLFNQVMQIPDHSKNSGTVRGGGGSSSSSSTFSIDNLSPQDRARYNELTKEKEDYQKAQTAAQYQSLAQEIMEIAQTKKEDFHDVIKDMKIDQASLEKGLGIANDKDFDAYMQKLEDQQDSDKNNAQSIVDAVDALPIKIAEALGPYLGGPGAAPTTKDSSTNGGTDPNVQTVSPTDFRDAVYRGVRDGFSNVGGRFVR